MTNGAASTPYINQYVIWKHGWNIFLGQNSDVPQFQTRNRTNTAWEYLPATKPVPVGKWTFLAGVYSPQAQRMEIYING